MTDVEERVRDLEEARVDAASSRGRQEQMLSDIAQRVSSGFQDVKDGFRQIHFRIDEVVKDRQEDEKAIALVHQRLEARIDSVEKRNLNSLRKKKKIVAWVVGTATAIFLLILGAVIAGKA